MGIEMLAAILASSQLAVYGIVLLKNLNWRKKIDVKDEESKQD